MSTPSPFLVAQAIGNNFSRGMTQAKDENAIESILTSAIQSGNPEVLQNSIGKILSQVSPERQGAAVQYLEHSYNRIKERELLAKQEREKQRQRQAQIDAGINPDLPAGVQKLQYENLLLKERFPELFERDVSAQDNTEPQFSPTQDIGDVLSGAMGGVQGNMPVQEVAGASQIAKGSLPKNLRDWTDDQLVKYAGIKGYSEPIKLEQKRREAENRENRADTREMRKETLPLRQGYIEAANLARESIRNKTHLMSLIDTGKIDDPTFAVFAESLPFNLGKRMLSPETVEYKGGLVDEFGDLKNIFKGATRVKEVEIYENKLADLYLTDAQKKAILKSRLNASKVPIILEEAAATVEEKFPNLSALQFNKKVQEIAKPKLDALFGEVWGEQKAILDAAERKKKVSLSLDDPEDVQIIDQILKEANGNAKEAEKIAQKRGYKF